LKATLEKNFPEIEVELIRSKGGAFEIRHESELIYSKLDTGRFPEEKDIVSTLKSRA
jgi:selT/selW/selH-like putative selenoprotein